MNKDQRESLVPCILIVDDVPNNLKSLRDILEPEGYSISVASNGKAALRIAAGTQPDLILLDIMMPDIDGYEVCWQLKQDKTMADIPVIFVTARGETDSIVQGFDVGGVDYITKPVEKAEVLVRVSTHLKNAQLTKALLQKNRELETEIARRERAEAAREQAEDALMIADEELSMLSQKEAKRWGIDGFVGRSDTIRRVLDDIRQLQDVGTTSVLIIGESGTGKELIARAIHFGSPRAEGRFVALNCAAIPSELVESTLFGHVKGAFTGANEPKKGYFEMASGGTLFLDEIGDMSYELQAKLLRVLEDGNFTPVGGTTSRQANVRVVAATNANLQTKIIQRTFRSDLYFRLARFTVNLPPLRERREDIPLLACHFIQMFAQEMGFVDKEASGGDGREVRSSLLSEAALASLMEYHFPGNIRELKNIIEHALILSRGRMIQPEHLRFITPTATSHQFVASSSTPTCSPEQAEMLMVTGALAQTNGDVEMAARLLGIPASRVHQLSPVAPNVSGVFHTHRNRHDARTTNDASRHPTSRLSKSDEDRILAHVREYGSINNAECRQLLDVDINRANYLLNKMYSAEILERTGRQRSTRYVLCNRHPQQGDC